MNLMNLIVNPKGKYGEFYQKTDLEIKVIQIERDLTELRRIHNKNMETVYNWYLLIDELKQINQILFK